MTTDKQQLKLIATPNCDQFVVYNESMVVVNIKKTELKFNKPVY